MVATAKVRKMEEQRSTQLMNNEQAAIYLGISPRTLNNWRSRREGPKPTYLGRLVRYHIRELEKYIVQNTTRTA